MNHFLSLLDITNTELERLFELTDELKVSRGYRPLAGMSVMMIFQKPSLRTRVSFEVGVRQLGGDPVVLSQEGIGLGTRESAYDIANVLSGYGDMIVARVFAHDILVEMAHYSTAPVINALTDLSHPCQVLADIYTIYDVGRLEPGVKIAFVGDGNNVVNSWLELSMLYPMHFVLAAPHGFMPDAEILAKAMASGVSTIEITHDPIEAVRGADVVYTDVWTSMGQETEAEMRRSVFAPYQVNEHLMSYAPSDCLVMHCLPAHRGEEITDDVIDGPRSIVFEQAKNRLHVQKAIMARLAEHRKTQHSIRRRHRMPEMTRA